MNRATLDFQQRDFNAIAEMTELIGPVAGQAIPGPQPPMVFGFGGMPAASPAPARVGRAFRSVVGNEVREEVALFPSRFSYVTTRYDRWRLFRSRMLELLGPLFDDAMHDVYLSATKLEYWDRFIFGGAPDSVSYGDLFRSQSRHLPAFFLDAHSLWHSHTGYFEPTEAAERRLVNLNVDIFDFADSQPPPAGLTTRRSAGIYSMAQDSFALGHGPASSEDASNNLDALHTILKAIMTETISPAMAERIALTPGESP